MKQDHTWSNRLFDIVNTALLSLIGIICVLPFIYVLAVSFTAPHIVAEGGFILYPKEVSLAAYRYIFSSNALIRSLGVSIYITVVGTLLNLVLTSLLAYPLSRKSFKGRSVMLLAVLFTMLFNGGLIPTYYVVKSLHLIDSLWALMIPTAISAFNLIILKNFFQQMPDGIEDSAKIDGCNDLGILFRIVIPLSLPAIATFGLFYAVDHWNKFFSAVMYINNNEKWPIQVLLREIVINANSRVGDTNMDEMNIQPLTIKMAVIVFATLPIMAVYPFLQKHFAKGVMLGSVKG
ncbi:carbohydrate ABC transporter permease [Paenibacillus mesotrionivorans]|uniref:Carbohydrate ABC transporter permease n=1 Tax=Paenibacillus mesotrionivorans TaxID=3160968 RepID=A0ACC7NWI3_9BACL